MAKVLIIGASRGIGLETVRAALRAGHRVRALARSAASMPIQDANLDTVSGDEELDGSMHPQMPPGDPLGVNGPGLDV